MRPSLPDARALGRRQRTFLAGVLAPRDGEAESWVSSLRVPRGIDPESRLDVYVRGLPLRVAEALENDFPAVARILGRGPLLSLAARYAEAAPPESFDLGQVGRRLADFLKADPLTEELPFLPDLARFEWALARAFVARDEAPVRWEDLAAEPPDVVADRRFRLLAGSALVVSAWPLRALRATKDQPDDAVDLAVGGAAERLLVHRRGLEVAVRALDEVELRIVERLGAGATVAEVADGDAAPEPVVAGFRSLIGAGAIAPAPDSGRGRGARPEDQPRAGRGRDERETTNQKEKRA
jgi:hypothetical protein